MSVTTTKTITAGELERRLRDDVGVHVWNVLTDEFFKGELIPGSRRVPLDKLDDAVQRSSVAKNAPIIVYCSGPTCSQSREAAEKLTKLGYSKVEAFKGGLEDWKKTGHGIVGIGSER